MKTPAKNLFLREWKAEVGEEMELLTLGQIICSVIPFLLLTPF